MQVRARVAGCCLCGKNIVAVCSATTNDELRIYVSRNLGKIPVTLFFKTFDDRVGSGQGAYVYTRFHLCLLQSQYTSPYNTTVRVCDNSVVKVTDAARIVCEAGSM